MRDVKVLIDMDRLRAFTGLTKAALPDDASDERISDVLTMSGFLTQSGRMQSSGPAPAPPPTSPRPFSAPATDDYDPSWLTPQERARIKAAQEGEVQTHIIREG